MSKKFFLSLAAAAALSIPASAADVTGVVSLVFPCSETWYEVQVEGVTGTAPGGATTPVRFMIKSTAVGTERRKQLFNMALTSMVTRTPIWIGTQENLGVATGANCGSNNTAGNNVLAMSIYR